MFVFHDHLDLDPGPVVAARVEVAFTDASLDLQGGPERDCFIAGLARVVEAAGVPFARLHQVHGADVVEVLDEPPVGPGDDVAEADALVTTRSGTGLMIRVADCVPVLLVDRATGLIGAAHAGRAGTVAGVVPNTVERMRERGAADLHAWIGPHVCGGCYEVPAAMQEEVAAVLPGTRATTRWGTPSLDLGAGIRAQLDDLGVASMSVDACTLEDERLHSYRRDGAAAGRIAGLVWRR